MKKIALLLIILAFAVSIMLSCGTTSDNFETPVNQEEISAPVSSEVPKVTEGPEATETEKQTAADPAYTEFPKKDVPKKEDYDYYFVFKAPEGNPRDIVMDYMLKMAQIQWTPTTTWTTGWKNTAKFKVELTYEAGKTYYGLPYSDTRAPLSEFELFLDNGKFTPNSPYYEELIGNHCSSSMTMAYQQIIDLSYPAGLRPTTKRIGLLRFPDGIITPPSESTTTPNQWYSDQVLKVNDRDKIFEGYASLGKGDIVMKDTKNGGHTRMVSKVEVKKTVAGKINPGSSVVYCVEQTNAWYDNQKNSTWWIDKKYSFSQLYSDFFMPVTLDIFHEENPVIDDAVICMKNKNTPDSILKMLNGTIESNFPLSYVYITIKDSNGKTVGEKFDYNMGEQYKYNLRNAGIKLGIDKLSPGTYKYEVVAAIARGSATVESFEFTVPNK